MLLPCARRSYVLSYGFAFAALAFLPLLPNQKADTQARKLTRPRHKYFGIGLLAVLAVCILYSLTVGLLALHLRTPSTGVALAAVA